MIKPEDIKPGVFIKSNDLRTHNLFKIVDREDTRIIVECMICKTLVSLFIKNILNVFSRVEVN